jgi:DNA-binding XRE family transcriptional regulator
MLTGFQLKVSRGVLKLPVSKLATAINISRPTIIKLEKTKNLELIKCYTSTLDALELFFKSHHLFYPNYNSVSINTDIPIASTSLSVFQVRGARAALQLSLSDLSVASNIHRNTLYAWEKGGVLNAANNDLDKILSLKKYFLSRGVLFPHNFSIAINKEL